jgi:nucleoside-diphosphate-sugar epimerase
VLRFGYIYGAEVDALTTTFNAIMAGRPVVNSRDHHALAGWIHVGDAASAIAAAIDQRPTGQTLTVVDDRPASPAAFLKTFMEAQGMSAPGNLPPFLGRALVGKTQYALLNAASHVDNADAKTALNWKPRFSTTQQGIEDVLLSWRAAIKA